LHQRPGDEKANPFFGGFRFFVFKSGGTMSAKTCVDCGVVLTAQNSNLISGRCVDCMRMPYTRSKAFFDRLHPTEQDVQNWPISKTTITFVGYVIFLFACTVLGCIVGFGIGGTYRGLTYSFVATLLGIVLFRWRMMGSASVHPLDSSRWFNFAFPYSLIFFLAWAMAYMGWMPTLAGRLIAPGSILSHHVVIAPSVTFPAFGLALLVGIVASLIGVAVGYFNASRQDAKNKAHLLSQLRRWQQGKA
jgi:hypothetical protein